MWPKVYSREMFITVTFFAVSIRLAHGTSGDGIMDNFDTTFNDPVDTISSNLVSGDDVHGLHSLVKTLQTQLRQSWANFAHTRSILNVIQEKQISQDRVIEILKNQVTTVQSQQKKNTAQISILKKGIADSRWGIADLKVGQNQVKKDIHSLKRTQELTNTTILEFEDFMASRGLRDRDYRRAFGRIRLDISSLRSSVASDSQTLKELQKSYDEHITKLHTSGSGESNTIPVIAQQTSVDGKDSKTPEEPGITARKEETAAALLEEKENIIARKLNSVLNHKHKVDDKMSDFNNQLLKYDATISNLQKLFMNLTLQISQLENKLLTVQYHDKESKLELLQSSFMNFTQQIVALEHWRMGSQSYFNTSDQNQQQLGELRDLVHAQKYRLEQLELEFHTERKSNAKSFQYLNKHISNLNESTQQYSVANNDQHSTANEVVERVNEKLRGFQKEVTDYKHRLAYAEAKIYNASMKACEKGNKDLYQDTKLAVFEKDFRDLELKILNSGRSTRRIDSEVARLYGVVNQAGKTMNGIATELSALSRMHPEVLDMKREVQNLLQQLPRDCHDIYWRSNHRSGLYLLRPEKSKHSAAAYCDMSAGGPWTVIQRRTNGRISFNKTWDQYKNGFGNPKSDFWIGNEALHHLTKQTNYSLLIEMWDLEGKYWVAEYGIFKIDSERERYKLTIGGYHGNATDALHYSNNMAFSTYDRDNDASSTHCAKFYTAGWWYKHCHYSNLNGRFSVGIVWFNHHINGWMQMKRSVMKLKRANDVF